MQEGSWTVEHLNPQEMVEAMKKYIELPSELDYYLILEFSILSRLRGLLPDDICVYLLFYGPSGTGKSHAGQFITEISGGEWLQAVSEGALLAGVSSGKLIGIDEIDGQSKRIESTEDILRIGHIWNAIYRKMATKGNDYEPRDIECGGPKVLTSIGLPEEGLASRCYAIEMSKSSKHLDFTVRWPYRYCEVGKIRESLDIYAQKIKDQAGTLDLEKWHNSTEHLAQLEKLRHVHARRGDLANVFTTVDHLLGWDVSGIVEALAKETIDEEMETLRSYLRELERIEKEMGVDIEEKGIKATRILEYINQRRKDAGQRSLAMRVLGRKLIEIGFTEQGNKVRRSDGVYYIFNTSTDKILQRGLM